MTFIQGSGYIAADPQAIETGRGDTPSQLVKIVVIEHYRRFDKNTGVWADAGQQTFTVFPTKNGGHADAALANLSKGAHVMFAGQLRVTDTQRGGSSYHTLEVWQASIATMPAAPGSSEDSPADDPSDEGYLL